MACWCAHQYLRPAFPSNICKGTRYNGSLACGTTMDSVQFSLCECCFAASGGGEGDRGRGSRGGARQQRAAQQWRRALDASDAGRAAGCAHRAFSRHRQRAVSHVARRSFLLLHLPPGRGSWAKNTTTRYAQNPLLHYEVPRSPDQQGSYPQKDISRVGWCVKHSRHCHHQNCHLQKGIRQNPCAACVGCAGKENERCPVAVPGSTGRQAPSLLKQSMSCAAAPPKRSPLGRPQSSTLQVYSLDFFENCVVTFCAGDLANSPILRWHVLMCRGKNPHWQPSRSAWAQPSQLHRSPQQSAKKHSWRAGLRSAGRVAGGNPLMTILSNCLTCMGHSFQVASASQASSPYIYMDVMCIIEIKSVRSGGIPAAACGCVDVCVCGV